MLLQSGINYSGGNLLPDKQWDEMKTKRGLLDQYANEKNTKAKIYGVGRGVHIIFGKRGIKRFSKEEQELWKIC